MNPHVAQVIITVEKVGKGIEGDPVRGVTRIYTLDGKFIAQNDSCSVEDQEAAYLNNIPYENAKRTTH